MMIKCYYTLILLGITFYTLGAQEKLDTLSQKEIGVSYIAELGLRPGVEIDLRHVLWQSNDDKSLSRFQQNLDFRPAISYYHFAKSTHNVTLSANLNYKLQTHFGKSRYYLFFEPYGKIGFLRFFYSGDVYEATANGFEAKKLTGGNALMLGGGFNIGSKFIKGSELVLGSDYFMERSREILFIHRVFLRIGLRYKL